MRLALFAAAVVGCLNLAAADDKKPSDKRIDWGKYSDHTKLVGEVDKPTETGFTLKIYKAGRTGRPVTEAVDLEWHENGLVRWAKQPPKLDGKGKKVPYTDKEAREFKLPPGAPGYAADKADLVEGTRAEVHLLKPKTGKPSEFVSTDYKVKFAVLLDPPAAKDAAKPGDKDKKGKGGKKP